MRTVSRRALLETSVTVAALGLAGCSADRGRSPGDVDEADTPTKSYSSPTATATATPEMAVLTALELRGRASEQSSSGSPAVIQLTLSNPLDESVKVRRFKAGGSLFDAVPPLEGETGEAWLMRPGGHDVKVIEGTLSRASRWLLVRDRRRERR